MSRIKSLDRSYRGDSIYYEVGHYITLDRGYGIENIKIGAIREDDTKFTLIGEDWIVILEIYDKEGIKVEYL